ncbi:hypothetical protein J6TS2_27360 [Heyndrickxia sporothermodurans]|nr:hypothetical protein J6TS2_27360 [Heyndrickxia sporothermodurans]
MDWSLENVEKVSQLNTSTFFIPTSQERRSQKKGDYVRLHFLINNPSQDGPRAERMWVEIIDKKLFGKKFVGILTNQPVYINSLNLGDQIEFEPKHIAQVLIKQDDPRWLEIGEQMALVSKKCLETDGIVRWLYREEPDREEDSGWRLFSGDESEEYLSNPANIKVMNVYYLLDKDPSLIYPFKGGIGSAFERENNNSSWDEVKDW